MIAMVKNKYKTYKIFSVRTKAGPHIRPLYKTDIMLAGVLDVKTKRVNQTTFR